MPSPTGTRLGTALPHCSRRVPPPPPPIRPNGLRSPEPAPKPLQRGLDQLAAALASAAGQFAVDLAGEGPAGRDSPLRRPPKPPDPPPAPKPTAPTRIVLRAAPSPAPASTRPVPPSVPITPPAPPGNLSSSGFWALMDGWGVDDQTALSLLRHEGGLTKKGTRPRFKLDAAEAERFAFLREIDSSLRSLGLDARKWLATPTGSEPFGGQAPLVFLATGGSARDVNRSVLQQGLRLSMGKSAPATLTFPAPPILSGRAPGCGGLWHATRLKHRPPASDRDQRTGDIARLLRRQHHVGRG